MLSDSDDDPKVKAAVAYFANLINLSTAMTSRSHGVDLGEADETRATIQDCVPWIVIAGKQSSGKSSLVNRLFNLPPGLAQRTDSQFATRCPTELHAHSNYTKPSVEVDMGDGSPQQLFPTYAEAYDFMASKVPDGMEFIRGARIIMHFTADVDLTVIDLPGFVAADSKFMGDKSHSSEYMEGIQKQYFLRKNSIRVMVVPGDQELGTDDVTKFWLQEDGDITYVVSKCDRDAASVEDIPARLAKRKNCRVVACTAAGAQVDGEHVDDEDAVNELLGCDDEGTKYIRGTRALLRTWPVGSPSTPKRQRQILSRCWNAFTFSLPKRRPKFRKSPPTTTSSCTKSKRSCAPPCTVLTVATR